MLKKKVSFDIDAKVLNDVKARCVASNTRFADFYRDAVIEKLERESNFLEVVVFSQKNINTISIPLKEIEYDIFDASDRMKVNVGAIKEGIIYNISHIKDRSLKESLADFSLDDRVHFFTIK